MKDKDNEKSIHYLGEKGKEYFEFQNLGGSYRSNLLSKNFSKYIDSDDVVLDFGCGAGHIIGSLNCKEKYGIEINPHARREAKKYNIKVFEDFNLIKAKTIDKVISNHALEHVACPIKVLKQIYDCLKPGGLFILCIPINDWRMQRYYKKNDPNHHLYTWTPQLIGNCLSDTGFDIISIKIINRAWPTLFGRKRDLIFTLDRLFPDWFIDMICYFASVFQKRRQIIAVGKKK